MIEREQTPESTIFSTRPFETRCEIRAVIQMDSKERPVARLFFNNFSKFRGYNLSEALLFVTAVRAVIEEAKKFTESQNNPTREEEIRNRALERLKERERIKAEKKSEKEKKKQERLKERFKKKLKGKKK